MVRLVLPSSGFFLHQYLGTRKRKFFVCLSLRKHRLWTVLNLQISIVKGGKACSFVTLKKCPWLGEAPWEANLAVTLCHMELWAVSSSGRTPSLGYLWHIISPPFRMLKMEACYPVFLLFGVQFCILFAFLSGLKKQSFLLVEKLIWQDLVFCLPL